MSSSTPIDEARVFERFITGAVAERNTAASRRADAREAWREVLLLMAGFSCVAAFIHFEAAALHFKDVLLYSILFELLAVFQLAWAWAIRARPSRAVLWLGLIVSAATVVVWVVSRTTGIPVGPEAGRPEPVGALDIAACLDELAIVALAIPALRGWRRGFANTDGLRLVVFGVLTLTVMGALLGWSSHSH